MTPDPDSLPARLAALAALDAWSEAPLRAAMAGLERGDGTTTYELRIPTPLWREILLCAESDNVSVQAMVLSAVTEEMQRRRMDPGD